MMLATYASYARKDARNPFRAAVLRSAVALVGLIIGLRVPAGGWALLAVGSSISVAAMTAGIWMSVRLRRSLPSGGSRLSRPILRTAALSVVMALLAYVVSNELPDVLPALWRDQVSMLVAVVVAVAIFLSLERACRSPELTLLREGLRDLRGRST